MKRVLGYLSIIILVTFLFQGFQCSNKEVANAKLAINQADWQKAKMNLEAAIQKNPKNDEAWYMLAEVKEKINDFKGAAEALMECETIASNPKIKGFLANKMPTFRNAMFNKSIEYYNKYSASKELKFLDTSVFLLDVVTIVRPEYARIPSIKGMIMEIKKDTTNAIIAYGQYAALMEKDLKIARDKGIFINMTRDEFVSKFGKPTLTIGHNMSSEADTTLTDSYSFEGKDFFLFSARKGNTQFKVKGWRFDPNAKLQDWERNEWSEFDISPYAALSSIYYDRKDYDKSLKNIKTIIDLQPDNAQAQAFMVELFQAQGKQDDAKKMLTDLATKYPDNKYYVAQLGDFLLLDKKYDEAVQQYEKALKIDPEFDGALRNIGTAYKNKAGIIQKRQREAKDADKNYKENLEEYFPFLKKSGEYFEKSRKSDRFKYDLEVLSELVNIYEVLDDQAKISYYKSFLESLEGDDEVDKKEYYRIMCKVYTILKETEKSKAACSRFEELIK